MSTITKERIELFIKNPLENGLTRSEQMEVARIALASLEADPIGEVSEKRYGLIMDGTVDLGGKSTYRIIKGEKAMKLFPLGTKFYTAPPAPVSVPAAMEIDDDFDSAFEHGKAVGWNAYRAAMLQAEPVSNSDELPLDYLQGHKDGTGGLHNWQKPIIRKQVTGCTMTQSILRGDSQRSGYAYCSGWQLSGDS